VESDSKKGSDNSICGVETEEEEEEIVTPPPLTLQDRRKKIAVQKFNFTDKENKSTKPAKRWFSAYRRLRGSSIRRKSKPSVELSSEGSDKITELTAEGIYDNLWLERQPRDNHTYLYWDYVNEDPFSDHERGIVEQVIINTIL